VLQFETMLNLYLVSKVLNQSINLMSPSRSILMYQLLGENGGFYFMFQTNIISVDFDVN